MATSETKNPNETEDTRPIGVKKAKQLSMDHNVSQKKIELLEKNTAEGERQGTQISPANGLQCKTNMIQKRWAETEQEQANIRIMGKDLSNLTNEYTQEFFLKKKRNIFLNFCQKEAEEEKKLKERLKQPKITPCEAVGALVPNLDPKFSDLTSYPSRAGH
ncbi:uncharacterized protein VP01_5175g2 [Puccinia sorghi]|uniref:No apical meristem-associated C-terminal domain-containing protein n=1 Tax=Puccinia sorghi TaxID=27349 RepID=A0A0L6ULK4_9BASI|nr:uncharacterized protein VP01_5175g2 [Puccinia sorghi]